MNCNVCILIYTTEGHLNETCIQSVFFPPFFSIINFLFFAIVTHKPSKIYISGVASEKAGKVSTYAIEYC